MTPIGKILHRAAFSAILAGTAGCASTATAPSTPHAAAPSAAWLRGADCLDPGMARSWNEISTTELLVDAGRRKYRLTLPPSCVRIGTGPVLRFDGDPISGRVCGVPTDAVLLDGGQRCLIERLELVDQATWSDAANERDGELHGETPVR